MRVGRRCSSRNSNLVRHSRRSRLETTSGYLAHVNEDCTGCEDCVETCQFKALSLDEEKGVVVVKVENCMGCGVCEDICPADAITLKPEPSKCEPLDIEKLVQKLEF